MLSLCLYAPLAALITYVAAVVAAPSLVVRTSFNSNLRNVEGSNNLKVTTTVVNTGGRTLKLFNDPRGVLDPFPENTFSITNATGFRPPFNGAKATYVPTQAADLGHDPSAFTVLAPGDFIDITHDLSVAYDFTQAGTGNYTITPSNFFTYVDADGALKDLYATVDGVAKVELFSELAVSRHVHDKRATFAFCYPGERDDILAAADAAQDIVDATYDYVEALSKRTDRFKTWFGPFDATSKSVVLGFFQEVRNEFPFLYLTYNCSCEYNQPGVIAYTKRTWPGTIWVCNRFFENLPRDRIGTLIHEATHFADDGIAVDGGYGRDECKQLAIEDPWVAMYNADNHQYFAMNYEGYR